MSDNARDTQFQGFAKALVEELTSLELEYMGVTIDNLSTMSRYYREEWEKIIARRAYDLANHAIDEFIPRYEDSSEEYMRRIPDMTELPKEQGNE